MSQKILRSNKKDSLNFACFKWKFGQTQTLGAQKSSIESVSFKQVDKSESLDS